MVGQGFAAFPERKRLLKAHSACLKLADHLHQLLAGFLVAESGYVSGCGGRGGLTGHSWSLLEDGSMPDRERAEIFPPDTLMESSVSGGAWSGVLTTSRFSFWTTAYPRSRVLWGESDRT